MSLHEASFRVKHECPYREISEHYPDLTIREWYLSDCQVIEITSPESPTEELLDEIDHLGTILHKSVDESGLLDVRAKVRFARPPAAPVYRTSSHSPVSAR